MFCKSLQKAYSATMTFFQKDNQKTHTFCSVRFSIFSVLGAASLRQLLNNKRRLITEMQ